MIMPLKNNDNFSEICCLSFKQTEERKMNNYQNPTDNKGYMPLKQNNNQHVTANYKRKQNETRNIY